MFDAAPARQTDMVVTFVGSVTVLYTVMSSVMSSICTGIWCVVVEVCDDGGLVLFVQLVVGEGVEVGVVL